VKDWEKNNCFLFPGPKQLLTSIRGRCWQMPWPALCVCTRDFLTFS